MLVKKYFYSIVFFLFMALLMSLPLTAKGAAHADSKATSYETYCPYQNPPKDEDLPKTAQSLSPKVIDKGDFYFTKIAKVNLLRFRDRVAITGEATRIEQIIQDAKSGKDHRQKSLDEKKNTYLYTFMDIREEDEASEVIEKLKDNPEIQFISPVFYSERSGLSMILTDEITVKLKEGYGEDDLLAVSPSYVKIRKAGPFRKNVYLLTIERAKEKNLFEIANMYKDLEIIEWSQPVFLCEVKPCWEPNDPYFSQQWHLKNTGQGGGDLAADIDANQAWDLTLGDPNIVIAVINAGVQTDHPDLADNIWTNPNVLAGDLHGWNF